MSARCERGTPRTCSGERAPPLHFRSAIERGRALEESWNQKFEARGGGFPELARELARRFSCELPDGWAGQLRTFPADAKGLATT